jgi:hypothetical protein
MNIQQAQILIEKINALWRSMTTTPGQISAIERDLMLSYIRNLYETFALEIPAPAQVHNPPPPPSISEPIAPKPASVPQPVSQMPENDPPQPKIIAPPPPPKPAPEKVSVPEVATPISKSSKHFDTLFVASASGDLSDKLSRQPISDLNKAFAINDRLLYINDLFGKDPHVFADTIRVLDRFQNIAEAKALLLDIAEQYNWLDEARAETAHAFVQLIQRRYLK